MIWKNRIIECNCVRECRVGGWTRLSYEVSVLHTSDSIKLIKRNSIIFKSIFAPVNDIQLLPYKKWTNNLSWRIYLLKTLRSTIVRIWDFSFIMLLTIWAHQLNLHHPKLSIMLEKHIQNKSNKSFTHNQCKYKTVQLLALGCPKKKNLL